MKFTEFIDKLKQARDFLTMITIIKEIMSSRSLLWQLVLKNLRIRYSRPYFGFLWAFFSPFFAVIVYYVVFSIILRSQIEEAPFFLYLMSALFPWRFFNDSIACSVTSLVDNKNLIRESAFPQYLIPLSIVLENFISFLPSLLILLLASAFVLKGFSLFIIILPVILAIHLAITAGLAVIFSILYVKWRDMKYLIETILLSLLLLTPVFYSLSWVKSSFTPFLFKVYICNPFVAVLNLYRFAMLKGYFHKIDFVHRLLFFIIPVIFVFLVLIVAYWLYRRNRRTLNDYLAY